MGEVIAAALVVAARVVVEVVQAVGRVGFEQVYFLARANQNFQKGCHHPTR